MRIAVGRLAVVALAGLLSAGALAATASFTGSLAPGAPTMPVVNIATPNCGAQGVTPVMYRPYPFAVDAPGSYNFTVSGPLAHMYLYAGSFNPATPAANCIAASNSDPVNINVNLTVGTNYTLVIFDDSFLQNGTSFAAAITGPGNVAVVGPCSDFTDLQIGTPFCANVQWLKNRAVTNGCTTTQYCPNDPVSRSQMAAFMNRLGNALQPTFIHATQSGAQTVANADGVVCQTTDYAVAGHPRVAMPASVMFYHSAGVALEVSTRLVYSLNAGSTWSNFGTFVTLTTNVAGAYVSQSPAAGPKVFVPGQSVRFGIRTNSATASVTNAGCEMTVRLDSSSGTVSPFDAAPDPDLTERGPSSGG